MTQKPLMIDLFAGLGGWADGGIAEGYHVVGFDIERHDYGDGAKYPAQLVLQDVMKLHGKQFKDAALIVASPPCQEYSYMAMPWSKAKKIEHEYKTGVRDRGKLTELFDACFRIQHEACEAGGRFIPLVVENVRGAQKWVGRSRWNYGSYHLWGDVPALMPMSKAIKNNGGSWFNIGSPRQKETNRNPVHALSGQKLPGNNASSLWSERRTQRMGDGLRHAEDSFYCASSGIKSRKAASAAIAKIPFPLAAHVAWAWHPSRG